MSESEQQEKKKKFDESQHVKRLEFAKQIPKPKANTSSSGSSGANGNKSNNNNQSTNLESGIKSSGDKKSVTLRPQSDSSNYNRAPTSASSYNGTIYEEAERDLSDNDYASGDVKQTLNFQKPSRIEELENLHLESRLQIEAIKKSLRL